MKQKTLLILFVAFATKLFSQCSPTDTVSMGPGYANDVFYSLKNGTVKTESNSNWHIAFSVQPSKFPLHPETGVSIRVNSVKGNVLTLLPTADPINWRAIDTTGLSMLPERLDSFETWDFSAFTKEYNIGTAPFDFIWGTYSSTTKNVGGTKVFVLYNKTANLYKKIFIKECTYDTMWNVIMSNIDNTDSVNLIFDKGDYPNRLFVYYDMVNKQLNNREPARTDWDIVWTRYKDVVTQNSATLPYSLTGILANKDITIAKNIGKKCNEVYPGNVTAPYTGETNIIGWDWKAFNGATFDIADTFVYFVKSQDNKTYKLSFNSFVGASNGNTVLNGRDVTSVKDVRTNKAVSLYPNPTNGFVTLNTNDNITGVKIIDINGREQALDFKNNTVNISEFANGIYILQVETSQGTYTNKIIKQ